MDPVLERRGPVAPSVAHDDAITDLKVREIEGVVGWGSTAVYPLPKQYWFPMILPSFPVLPLLCVVGGAPYAYAPLQWAGRGGESVALN